MTRRGAVKRWRDELASWMSSLRFSGFTVLVVVLVGAGAIIVSPSLTTYIQQQREIAELRESVAEHEGAVDDIDAERAQWRDPVYVRAQARERLFYVMPGETQLNVVDDIVLPAEHDEETNAELAPIDTNWAQGVAASVLGAGITDATPAELGAGTAPDTTGSEAAEESTQ